jgi:ribosomal-protein-alanine N-acetyltransferase
MIPTPRLRLIPGTEAMLQAELRSSAALGLLLDAEIPSDWPPELYDEGAIRYMLGWLTQHPGEHAWGFYYVVLGGERPVAVGAGGYKGGPTDGAVEIGYSIVPSARRRGYAREAVDGWLAHAFADPRVDRVLAHTLIDLAPSIAVLRSAGFAFNGAGADPEEPSAVQYVITREAYATRRHRD